MINPIDEVFRLAMMVVLIVVLIISIAARLYRGRRLKK